VTGRAGVRYVITPELNTYAVYGVGKRPETLNLSGIKPLEITPKETLKSAEIGVKARLLEGRLVGDASVFHYDYENFQTLGYVDGLMATVNAGRADADGFETQLSWNVARGATMFGSYGYSKARFQSQAYQGNRFRNSPDHKFAIGANLEYSLMRGTLQLSPVYSWQSKMSSSMTTIGSTCSGARRLPIRIGWSMRGIPTFIAGTRRTYRAELSVNF